MKHLTHPYGTSTLISYDGTISATEPVVSQVLIESLSNGHLVRHSDIHLILHQEKLAQLGERVASTFIDSMQSNSSSTSMPDGITDDQIISTIKSKYVQSPAELSAWMDHLKSTALKEVESAAVHSQDKENSNHVDSLTDPSTEHSSSN